MKKELQRIQHALRVTRLLKPAEFLRYTFCVLRSIQGNRAFKKSHPGFVTPPKRLAFDAYAAINWNFYYRSGKTEAAYLVNLINKYYSRASSMKLLEWGCGPARIIRHLPSLLNERAEVFGSDYNPETVNWATRCIPGVTFRKNELLPPLPFDSNTFNFAYAFSVFTHLSEPSFHLWIKEIARVLKEDALFFFTTHSDTLSGHLLPHERAKYTASGFVERGLVQEGRKMFASFHSPKYIMEHMSSDWQLLQHIVPAAPHDSHNQDRWLFRKKALNKPQ